MIDFTPYSDRNRPGYDDPGWLVNSVSDGLASLDRPAPLGCVLVGRLGYGVVTEPTKVQVYGVLSPGEHLQKRIYATFSSNVLVLNSPHYQPWPKESE